MKYSEFKKQANLDYLGLGPELLIAALAVGAGALGGGVGGLAFPLPQDKKKSKGRRFLEGLGKGSVVGAAVAGGSALGRNGVIFAAKEGWI